MALQETKVKENTKEARKQFTWYFSGEKQHTKSEYTAGVGFVISNDFVKYVEDIIPHSARIIQIKFKGTIQINRISVYMPQAGRTEEDKEIVYKELSNITSKAKGKGPMYIMGDWNARMQRHISKTERMVFGKWTFDSRNIDVKDLADNVAWNRNRCINFCLQHKLILTNTLFKKPIEKTATHRIVGVIETAQIQKNTHQQIDFIATQTRWKNSVKNAESDTQANINSDHYPVLAKIQIKLRAIKTTKQEEERSTPKAR